MKQIVYIFIVFIVGCSDPNVHENMPVEPPYIEINDLKEAVICKVYQYIQNDTNGKRVTRTIHYLPNGKIAKETYNGYKESDQKSKSDATYYYDYKDSLLVQKRVSKNLMGKDSSVFIMTYNDNGKCIKEIEYNYKKRIRSDVDKGLGRPGGCIITDEDFESEASWAIRDIVHYTYDSLGRKTESYAPDIHPNGQNRYTWLYNEIGQIDEYRSYDHEELIWIEKYSYLDSVYFFTRTWYDYEGNPKHLKDKKSGDYWPQYTFTFKLDKNKREIEKIVSNIERVYSVRATTEYNENGRISKMVQYDEYNIPEMTHLYEYIR